MRPLPEMDIIPPFSAENKEADVDRDKRKMLTNNVNMMQMEVTELNTCNPFSDRGRAEKEPRISIPVPAVPVSELLAGKSQRICNSLN